MDRRAFSLIELLVVVAIIALLGGVLSPCLWSARQQARGIVCSSNVKQLGLALTAYEQMHGLFPNGFDDRTGLPVPSGGFLGDPTRDKMGTWWFHQLDPGDPLDPGSILWCASRRISDPGLYSNVLLGNYGVNRSICKDACGLAGCSYAGRPPATAQISRPAAVLLVADSGYSLMSWQAAADSVLGRAENHEMREAEFYVPGLSINANRTFSSDCRDDALKGRHWGGILNAAYADGHMNSLSAEALLVEQTGNRWRNRSPLWLP